MSFAIRIVLTLVAIGLFASFGLSQTITISPKSDTIIFSAPSAYPTLKWSLISRLGKLDTIAIFPTRTSRISLTTVGMPFWERVSFAVQDSAHQATYQCFVSDQFQRPPSTWSPVPADSEITLAKPATFKLLVVRNSIAADSVTQYLMPRLFIYVDPLPFDFTDRLEQNYPNPFNPGTTISFVLKRAQQVSITIYNVLGQLQATIMSGRQTEGRHSLYWNANGAPSGTYFCQLVAEDFTLSKKLSLLR